MPELTEIVKNTEIAAVREFIPENEGKGRCALFSLRSLIGIGRQGYAN
ncbi:MAG: hypothetical protein JSR33_13745 [Proteobacteria bacterium]|nr:hypothetical protein [Pseudomonadota bacterium]